MNGLPPNITEADFRKHFSATGHITDIKLIPNRRIGFVGYRSSAEAEKAVKYFNKSYIRLSRLRVEIATPIQSSPEATTAKTGANAVKVSESNAKHQSTTQDVEENPKLKEYLEISRSKRKKRHGEDIELELQNESNAADALAENHSDDEYEDVPRPVKRVKQADEPPVENNQVDAEHVALRAPSEGEAKEGPAQTSDADWARSRTSRLLGLLDDDEDVPRQVSNDDTAVSSPSDAISVPSKGKRHDVKEANSIPTPPSDNADSDEVASPTAVTDVEKVRSTMRLFVRNLPYDVKADELEAEFEQYGDLEEVCRISPCSFVLFRDELSDRDN